MPRLDAHFVWKLARRHTWGSPIPRRELVDIVTKDEDHDDADSVLEDEVLPLEFVVHDSAGIYVPNGRDAHLHAAEWLQDNTSLEEYKIAATLSLDSPTTGRRPDRVPYSSRNRPTRGNDQRLFRP